MPSAMFTANALFLGTLVAVAGLFVYGMARAGRTLGEPTAHTGRWRDRGRQRVGALASTQRAARRQRPIA